MKKENLKYVWLAIFVTMVCTIITCQSDDSSEASMDIKEEAIETPVVEPVVEPIIETIVEPIIEPTIEVEVEEAPIEFIPPVDTLERKEFYDQNDWKYDETVPSEDEDGQD
tara:strand:+ start:1467 stop:1799 length:333 start_codon:yes stop_codon:yes gene_type:complete